MIRGRLAHVQGDRVTVDAVASTVTCAHRALRKCPASALLVRSISTHLRLFDLPVFSSLGELCALLHLEEGRVRLIAQESFRFYRRYDIPKKSGGLRSIRQPTPEVKAIQAWILRNILDQLKPSPFATAFIRGVGLNSNVSPHAGNRYFLCVDIEDFFPSISVFRVYNLFYSVGYCIEAARLLAELCTVQGHLPQGGVTSPALANLVCARLDRRLAGLCSRRGLVFTRYADDLTFSSNNPAILRRTYGAIQHIVSGESFLVNARKTRVMGPKTACPITGLMKNSALPQFSVGRERIRLFRAEMHRVAFGDSGDRYKSEAAIMGLLAFVRSVSESQYTALLKYWDSLRSRGKGERAMS